MTGDHLYGLLDYGMGAVVFVAVMWILFGRR